MHILLHVKERKDMAVNFYLFINIEKKINRKIKIFFFFFWRDEENETHVIVSNI